IPVPDRVLLDASAFLGAGASDQARLRSSSHPHASGRPRRPRDDQADRALLPGARRPDDRALRGRELRARLPRLGTGARRGSPGARCVAASGADTRARGRPLPLLAPVPGAAVRRRRPRPGALVLEPEIERTNVVLGLWLFGLFLVLLVGTVAVAFIYLAAD